MKNKLFLICPDCQIDHFIKEKYGNDIFFLTALGAVFNFNEVNYIEAIADFMERESIAEIFIVNDTSCRFIKSILEKEKGYGTYAEHVLLNLLIDNYSNIMVSSSLMDKKKTLMELNIQRQALEILSNELFLPQIVQAKIRLKGLITTKAENKIKEVNVKLKESYK